jgi:hypothetical protein
LLRGVFAYEEWRFHGRRVETRMTHANEPQRDDGLPFGAGDAAQKQV